MHRFSVADDIMGQTLERNHSASVYLLWRQDIDLCRLVGYEFIIIIRKTSYVKKKNINGIKDAKYPL